MWCVSYILVNRYKKNNHLSDHTNLSRFRGRTFAQCTLSHPQRHTFSQKKIKDIKRKKKKEQAEEVLPAHGRTSGREEGSLHSGGGHWGKARGGK